MRRRRLGGFCGDSFRKDSKLSWDDESVIQSFCMTNGFAGLVIGLPKDSCYFIEAVSACIEAGPINEDNQGLRQTYRFGCARIRNVY